MKRHNLGVLDLQAKYRLKLRKYDQRHHGTRPGETGPLVALLESYGKLHALVVGPWGNGSEDLHVLVKTMAECRVASKNRARGEQASDWELGVAMGEIRRSLSLDFVRAEALCLLARVCLLGGGAKEAARRRVQAERDVEAGRRVERAHFAAHVRGRGRRRAAEIYTL